MCPLMLNVSFKMKQTNITVNNHNRGSVQFFMDVFLIGYKWC